MVFDKKCNIKQQKCCVLKGFWRLFFEIASYLFLPEHVDNGFFMNWFGTQKGEGMEYFILVLGLAISVLIGGSGKFSVDNWIAKKLK